MACLVVKDNITSGGALAVGQTLRLGSFIMTTRSAAAPTMIVWLSGHTLIRDSLTPNQQMSGFPLSVNAHIPHVGVKTGGSRVGGPELCV